MMHEEATGVNHWPLTRGQGCTHGESEGEYSIHRELDNEFGKMWDFRWGELGARS
jgi:hypothetical protein